MSKAKTFQTLQAAAIVLLLSMVIGGHASATKTTTNASRLRTLERQVGGLTASLDAANERIATLESLTQLLDHEGTYYGYVNGAQVWSHHCEAGAGASWDEVDGLSELSCASSEIQAATPRIGARAATRTGTPFDGRK